MQWQCSYLGRVCWMCSDSHGEQAPLCFVLWPVAPHELAPMGSLAPAVSAAGLPTVWRWQTWLAWAAASRHLPVHPAWHRSVYHTQLNWQRIPTPSDYVWNYYSEVVFINILRHATTVTVFSTLLCCALRRSRKYVRPTIFFFAEMQNSCNMNVKLFKQAMTNSLSITHKHHIISHLCYEIFSVDKQSLKILRNIKYKICTWRCIVKQAVGLTMSCHVQVCLFPTYSQCNDWDLKLVNVFIVLTLNWL